MRMMRFSDGALLKNGISYPDHIVLSQQVTQPGLLVEGVMGMGLIGSLAGELEVLLNGSTYAVNPNSFLVINKGSIVRLKIKKAPTHPLFLLFNERVSRIVATELFLTQGNEMLTSDALHDHQLIEHIHYSDAALTERLSLLEKLGHSCASFQALKADAIVRSLIKDLCETNLEAISSSSRLPVKKETTRTDLFKRLSIAKQWLEQHFKTSIDMETVAAIAMMDKAHFSRLFKATYGLSPYQHLMEVRLRWAEDRIINSEDAIQQIAEGICFEAPSSFSYQFKKWNGKSPKQLRMAHSRA